MTEEDEGSTVRIEAMSWRCWTRRIRPRTTLLTWGRVEVWVDVELDIETVGFPDFEVEGTVVTLPAREA